MPSPNSASFGVSHGAALIGRAPCTVQALGIHLFILEKFTPPAEKGRRMVVYCNENKAAVSCLTVEAFPKSEFRA